MVRSSKTGMQYSDDEGRIWIPASGATAVNETSEGAIAKNADANRIFTVVKTSSANLQVFLSNDNGESYNSLSTSFNPSNYKVKMFKAHNSESVFIAAFSLLDSKIRLYECTPDDSDFSLVNTSSTTFVGIDRAFGTYHNDNFHFYVAAKNSHIYYTGDKGATWQLKNSTNNSSGDTNPRTVHPTKPNIIFKGYLDVEKSYDYGSSFTNFSHLLGWDVWEMTMYQRKDLSFFHFVGMDFGCYISDTPEVPAEYVQLNNTAPIQMCYDADHSQNYSSSFTSTQDRGTVGFESSSDETFTTDVKTTDGLRVTLGNRESSVWTWMYYGSIFRKSNFAAGNSGLSQINWTSNWWAAPMIPSPDENEDAVYVPAGSRLTKFTFNSHNNQIIKTNHYFNFWTETGSKVSGLGYSPVKPNKWYVSVENGNFLYSVDGGQSFNETTYSGSLPRANDQSYNYSKNQHVIIGSKLNEDRVYYAGVGNVFLISNDGGKTFTNHNNGLDVYRIRDFDLTEDEKFIFAACAYGGIWVFSVEDDYWYPINDGPVPYVNFTDVEFMVKENTVNCASYGNGILKFKLNRQNSSIAYPDNLTVEISNNNHVNLQWQDKSENEDGFIVERSLNGEFLQVGSVASNQTSFTDNDLQTPGDYFYRVKAFNAEDESYYSDYAVATIKPEGEVSKSKWILLSVDSEDTYGGGNPAVNAFDENPGTFWFTQWSGGQPPHPHEIVIDMNETLNFIGFSYLPRQDGKTNGMIEEYEFYISSDNVTWTKVASGVWGSSADLK
nr:discoidin domain-containing protein [Bacteroidales bacterium]